MNLWWLKNLKNLFSAGWLFIFVGVIIFTAIGYSLISFIGPAITNFVLEQQKLNPVVFANRLAAEFLSPRDFELPITSETIERFENFANHLQITGLVRLEVANRDGIILYSDKEDLIGQRFPLEEGFKKALRLQSTAEIRFFDSKDPHHEHGVQPGEGLLISVPITFGDSKEVVGVVTIHSRAGFLLQAVEQIRNAIILRVVLSVTLLLLILSIVTIIIVRQVNLKEATERQLKHSEELARAKDEFVALASHQLRTPPSIISWYAEMLISEEVGGLNEEQKQYLKEIYQANNRMIKLVGDFLNISRIESGSMIIEPEPTNLCDVAENIIKEFTELITEKKMLIERHYDKDLPLLSVDRSIMTIIFENLISNAIKYTPPGGKVEVAIRKAAPNIEIEVRDNGYGIPKKDHDKVFTKLFRGDNIKTKVAEGTGLGLYLVKSTVEQAGGAVRFESEEGKGSTFYVTIPLSGMLRKTGVTKLAV